MEEPIRILIIDDDEVDRMTVKRALRKAGIQAETDSADSIDAAWEVIRSKTFDCVFLDYRLPGGDGLELLREFRQEGFQMPIIVVTSQGDEKIAVEVMKSGGTDYFPKSLMNPEGVSRVLRSAMRAHSAELERQRTARALEESQARLAEAQRIANIGNWEINFETGKRTWSDQVFEIMGYGTEDRIQVDSKNFGMHFHPDSRALADEMYARCVKEGLPF
ncbi:MAG: response regulator, partial [Bacteroidota bacterium]